jgi:predicted NBD/HSP70 family sugar kinase
MVEIEGDGAFFVGADIGVDRVTAVAIDLNAEVRRQAKRPFDGRGCDPDDAAATASDLVADVLRSLPPRATVEGVSVAIPGFLAADGHAYHAALLGWHGVDIAGILRRHLGADRPILVENDANAFAFAETYRKVQEPSDILVVLIESGVGGGIISGGRLHRGRLRGAGEIGHMPIGEEGFVFDARRPGRFESYVGKEALIARYRHCGGVDSDFENFIAAVAAEEPAARHALDDWAHWLARGLCVLSSTLEPQRIVLGGSVSTLYRFVAERVEAELSAALPEGYPMPIVEMSSFSGAGPALGAAYLLHQTMLSMDGQFEVAC